MSEGEKLSKSQLKKRRRAEKRKASGSPDLINSGHYTPDTSKSPGGTVSNFLMNSQDYVHSVMQSQSPVMNMNGQYTPVMQGMQGMHSMQSPQNVYPMQTPSWALSLIEDVKQIKSALPKIDEIEQTVKSIQRKMSELEIKVTNLETKSSEAENSLTFINDEYEKQKTALKNFKKKIGELESMCTKLNTSVYDHEKAEYQMQEKLLDLEQTSYSGKNSKKSTGANPSKARENHHKGKFNTSEYVSDNKKRANAFCKRKHTLFMNARALANLTGAKVELSVQHEDGRPAEVYRSDASNIPCLSAAAENIGLESTDTLQAPLSPVFTATVATEMDLLLEVKGQDKQLEKKAQDEDEVDERKCRVCGELEVDGKELWVGCEKTSPVCNYWVHVKCLGWVGMTQRFLKKMQWFCPKHA